MTEDTGASHTVRSKITTLVEYHSKVTSTFACLYDVEFRRRMFILNLEFSLLKCLVSSLLSNKMWGICKISVNRRTGRGWISFPFSRCCPSQAIKVRKSHGRIRSRFCYQNKWKSEPCHCSGAGKKNTWNLVLKILVCLVGMEQKNRTGKKSPFLIT